MITKRVQTGDISVGEKLFWNVFDKKGNLLLREGCVIESKSQLLSLINRGLYYCPVKKPERVELQIKKSPFEIIDDIYTRLDLILGCTEADQKIPSKILTLCHILQQACEQDLDACMGNMSFCKDYKYTVIHPIHTAVVCKIILKSLGWSAEERLMPMAAALTMNISMVDLQEKLHFQREPLTQQQRQKILSHPERSVDMLEKCGVRDEVWLNTVLQHHEFMDGSGYPNALKGNEIDQPARAVTIGDLYGAQTSDRTYRNSNLPTSALRKLFLNKDRRIDVSLLQILIKKFGLYPPGSFVELQNGEIAVVTHVGKDIRYPVLHSVVAGNGMSFAKPVFRNCAMEDFAIKRIIPQIDAKIEVNRYQLWGYFQ